MKLLYNELYLKIYSYMHSSWCMLDTWCVFPPSIQCMSPHVTFQNTFTAGTPYAFSTFLIWIFLILSPIGPIFKWFTDKICVWSRYWMLENYHTVILVPKKANLEYIWGLCVLLYVGCPFFPCIYVLCILSFFYFEAVWTHYKYVFWWND